MSQSLYDTATPNPAGYRDTMPAAVAAAPEVRRIDVRETPEFTDALGHAAGAELVPLATLEAAARAWDRAAEVVVICRSGGRSGKGAALLVTLGFSRVVNMVGGMLAWNDARLPTER
jgi:rhodanese-related sulfurtransferase